MAKDNKLRRKPGSKCSRTPRYLLPSKVGENVHTKRKCNKASEKKDWEDANCSVCMEFPHNAVLLLCSSYDKGCRPYMCATSRRYSNCLEQYKKAYTKAAPPLCPLCRGQVKGWTVVDPARKYLNSKKRSCMQDECKFVGSYKELRKHVKAKHPLARPRAVDPALEEKWKRLECDRERSDVISTIISSTPGAVVLGDYVLEPNQDGGFYSDFDSYTDDDDDLEEFDFRSLDFSGGAGIIFSHGAYHRAADNVAEDDFRARRPALSSLIGAASGRSLRRTNVFARRRWRTR